MKRFTYWLKHEAKDCGLCDPPMSSDQAIQFLKDYLLGENWYVTMSQNGEQCNTAIVAQILYNYSRKFRKEVRDYRRQRRS